MIKFLTIRFKNFMSFGNQWTEVDLSEHGTTFIIGENLDEGGSSGAGKSTLINAISYCLYDKIPSGISKDRLLNLTNEKKNTSMEVCLTFMADDITYTIRRWRGAQTGVQLLVTKDDVTTDVTPASVNRGDNSFNAKVEELVGFSYTLFTQVILFNGNAMPFLDLPVGTQRCVIEELFRITLLSRKAVALKRLISDTDKAIDMQKLLIQQQERQNETYRRHLKEANDRVERWNQARATELAQLEASLDAYKSVDFSAEEAIHTDLSVIRESITAMQGSIRELTAKRSVSLATAPELIQRNSVDHSISLIKKQITDLQNELAHLNDAKCPYCHQVFQDTDAKINEVSAKISENTANLAAAEADRHRLTAIITTFNEERDQQVAQIDQEIALIKQKLSEAETTLTSITSEMVFPDMGVLIATNHEINNIHQRLMAMTGEINPHVEAYQALVAEGEVAVDRQSLDDMIKLQEHQQFLHKLLTDKNSFIRKNILAKTIPFLNKRIAFYTEKLLLPHVVTFQSDMSCAIAQYGRKLDHGNLSNGEKKRLNMSLSLAFRDVLTYLHSHVNVMFTDEIDGGSLDANSVDSLIGLLKQKAWDDTVSIFVISHRPEFEGRCDRNVIVRKERGFSTLIFQPEE